jgi:hypothetical protein
MFAYAGFEIIGLAASEAENPRLGTAKFRVGGISSFGDYIYGVNINLSGLNASQIVETDASRNVISVAKATGYNLALGTTAGTVAEGNHTHNYQAPLNGTGFVKVSGTTVSYDNSTYLTAITKAMVEGVLTGTITSHDHTGTYALIADKFPGFGTNHTTAAYGDHNHNGVYLTSFTETDPTVPSWAKNATKPAYTYSEVGAAASGHNHDGVYEPASTYIFRDRSGPTDFNTMTGYGGYGLGGVMSNNPNGASSYGTLLNFAQYYNLQLYTNYDASGLYFRTYIPGTGYASWNTIWHSGNFTDNHVNWDTAYGWGNHASAGYVTRASANKPGITKLYRNDSDDAFNVQTTYSADVTGYWSLRGYSCDV